MPQKKKRRAMPPLPITAIRKLGKVEYELRRTIQNLSIGSNKSVEYLRAYVVEMFSIYYSGYSEFPARKEEWGIASMVNAQATVISVLREECRWLGGGEIKYWEKIISETLIDHIEETLSHQQIESADPKGQSRLSPKALHEKYRAEFPQVKILDICWAAHQTHREWKRWMGGDFVAGNTPDRSFRKILEGRKDARELRKEPRPKTFR